MGECLYGRWFETYEVVEEETAIEREARVVERECLAFIWCGREDDLSDALIFELGACSPYPGRFSASKPQEVRGAAIVRGRERFVH